jgi:hypothetical protein
VVLKLDMAKAFDRGSWDSLMIILAKFGFNEYFYTLIKHSIQNCWYSVLLNGQHFGFL